MDTHAGLDWHFFLVKFCVCIAKYLATYSAHTTERFSVRQRACMSVTLDLVFADKNKGGHDRLNILLRYNTVPAED